MFGSFVESTCAVVVLAASSLDLMFHWCSRMYPVLISSTGFAVGLLTMGCQRVMCPVKDMPDVEEALKVILVISTVLLTLVVVALSVSITLHLWSGLIIG